MQNRIAIITGGASGLGAAIAENFVQKGATVILADKNIALAAQLAAELTAKGGKAQAHEIDVSRRQSCQDLVAKVVAEHGSVDYVVAAAGITRYTPFLETTEADWNLVLGIDLCGVFFIAQAVAPIMMQNKFGKIVTISSSLGTSSSPHHTAGSPGGSSAYAAAKAGVIQLTKTLARELGPSGVNVNCIAPGTFVTPMTSSTRTPEQVREHIEARLKMNVLGRLGEPWELAEVAAFLCSDAAGFINGHTIQHDGGRTDRM